MTTPNNNNQDNGTNGKKEFNKGSGSFNQGAEQDPNFENGTTVSDEEKKTGHSDAPGKATDEPKTGGSRALGAGNHAG